MLCNQGEDNEGNSYGGNALRNGVYLRMKISYLKENVEMSLPILDSLCWIVLKEIYVKIVWSHILKYLKYKMVEFEIDSKTGGAILGFHYAQARSTMRARINVSFVHHCIYNA